MFTKPMPALLTIVALVAALVVAVPFAAAKKTNIHIASLKGSAAFPAANGEAKYGVDDGIRELEVELEDANSIKGAKLKVKVKGQLVGTMRVNSFGNARLVVRGSAVPAVQTGDSAAVRRASNGTLVASGKFN